MFLAVRPVLHSLTPGMFDGALADLTLDLVNSVCNRRGTLIYPLLCESGDDDEAKNEYEFHDYPCRYKKVFFILEFNPHPPLPLPSKKYLYIYFELHTTSITRSERGQVNATLIVRSQGPLPFLYSFAPRMSWVGCLGQDPLGGGQQC